MARAELEAPGRAPPWLGALAAAALLVGGCLGPGPVEVTSLAVAESPASLLLERGGVSRGELGAEAARLLGSAEGFTRGGGWHLRSRRCTAQVIVTAADVLVPAGGGSPVAQVELVLELVPDGGPARREVSRAAEPAGEGPGSLRAALRRAAGSALSRSIDTLSLELRAERKSAASLRRDLQREEVPARLAAVRALAGRGDRGAVPDLILRLRDPDPAVAEAAVGALAQLRDPRAVPALIERTRGKSGPEVAAMAHLLGDVGGPDARAWLVTVASGHPEAAVREAARQALADLEARAAAGPRR